MMTELSYIEFTR